MVERAQGCALRPRLTIPYLGVARRRGTITQQWVRVMGGVHCVTTDAGQPSFADR